MSNILKSTAFVALLALSACGGTPEDAVAVHDGWARETIGGVAVSAGYARIENGTGRAVRLVGAETPAAGRIEIHNVIDDNGVMRMREVAGGLDIPAGGSVALRPGGYHMMLLDLARPLRAGETIPVTLRFDTGDPLQAEFTVRSAAEAAGGHGHE